MRRAFWILITPALILGIAFALLQNYFAPKILSFAVNKIEQITEEQGPFNVRIGGAQLLYFPPGVRTTEVVLKPKKDFSQFLSDIKIQTAEARLELFSLVTGRLKVGLIEIDTPQVEVSFENDPNKKSSFKLPQELNWSKLMTQLQQVPLEQVRVKNLNFKLRDKKSSFVVNLSPTDLQVLQLRDLLQIKLSIPNATMNWDEKERARGALEFGAIVTPQKIHIQKLSLMHDAAQFQLSGELKARAKKSPQTQALWSGSVDLGKLHESLELIFPGKNIPVLSGSMSAQGSWSPEIHNFLNADFNISTKDVNVADFSVGNAQIKGMLRNDEITLDDMKAQHPAGNITIEDTKLTLNEEFPVSLKLSTEKIDMQKLFVSLNLKTIPVEMHLKANAPCEGKLKPLQFNCNFEATGSQIQVRTAMKKDSFEIVKIKTISTKGSATLDLDKAQFEGNLWMPKSKGETRGVVDFKKGFDIQFRSSNLDWSDIDNLSSLQLVGVSQLEGATKGDSNAAILEMHLKNQNHEMANFHLGNTEADLRYEKTHLYITNAFGNIEETKYAGQIEINLENSTLQGNFDFDKARLQDIKKALEKAIPVPISMEGNGSGKATFSGPLDFWKLNTDIKAQFQQVTLATENFNSLNIDIASQNGLYNLQNVVARRNNTTLAVSGTLSGEKELNLDGNLKNYLMEESNVISKMKWPISGQLNAQMKLTGTLGDPNLIMSGQFTEVLLEDNEVANSNFKMTLANQYLQAEGVFLGNQIQAAIDYPLASANKPLRLRLKTQGWDYTPWLSLVNAGVLNQDTSGQLTSEMELSSTNGKWENLSGHFKAQNFSLTKQDLTLQNTQPISITAQNGSFDIQNFVLNSPKGKVEVSGQNISANNFNLQINADTDLKLAQLFIPLFEEISGPIQIRSSISGSLDRPQLVGSLKIQNGYFRIKNFPHAFENIKVDTTFSQSRILFNEIHGNLGGGDLKGEGSMQIQGSQDIPMMLRFKARDVSLNLPDQVRTRGDADLTFSGRWFPFTLAGTYRIAQTNFEMGFGGGKMGNDLKQNFYLPQVIKEKVADPLNLDLQLVFEKPIQIKNSILEGQASGNLAVKGSPSAPVLSGKLSTLKGTKLFFKDKPFEIQSANVNFQNPNEINPDLFIAAQTRVDEYDVNLLVQGTAKDMTVRLSSQPPLAENDIISLLALGVTSTKLSTVESKEQQTQTANEVFAAAFQSTGLTQKVQSVTGFNVQLSNSFDTTRNISVPKFTISRKLNQKTNASVAFPVTGDQKTPEGRIQYNLNDNLSVNGSYETKKFQLSNTNTDNRETPSILGLDLEFKRDFR